MKNFIRIISMHSHIRIATAQSGFIAVMSAVVIGVLLMGITLSLGLTGFFSRFNVLDVEYRERSFSLAEGCADTVILRLILDRSYASYPGSETITIGSSTCSIISVTHDSPVAGQITIKTKSLFPQVNVSEKAVTNLVVVVSSTELTVNSWEEVP